MNLLRVLLILVAAGCATPPPQEELTLFESAEERARRDVLAVYYWEPTDGALSVVVSRAGPAEVRGEMIPLAARGEGPDVRQG